MKLPKVDSNLKTMFHTLTPVAWLVELLKLHSSLIASGTQSTQIMDVPEKAWLLMIYNSLINCKLTDFRIIISKSLNAVWCYKDCWKKCYQLFSYLRITMTHITIDIFSPNF